MSQDRSIWQTDRVIPSKTGAGKELLEEILAQLESQQWAQHDIFSVHLALEEALVNAIRHGNGGDAAKQVGVCCKLTADRLWIEIVDEGPGFDPDKVPDCTEADFIDRPCGRGIMLMRNFMSRVEYNERGNGVVLEKLRAKSA